jgi:hypothetical protein
MHDDMKNTYRTVIRKAEEKVPLRKHRHGWKDNIKTSVNFRDHNNEPFDDIN